MSKGAKEFVYTDKEMETDQKATRPPAIKKNHKLMLWLPRFESLLTVQKIGMNVPGKLSLLCTILATGSRMPGTRRQQILLSFLHLSSAKPILMWAMLVTHSSGLDKHWRSTIGIYAMYHTRMRTASPASMLPSSKERRL
jgi:hypothetical protein